jgi:monofunctional biosynthetic peptidoglycan transglycosylase
VARLPRLLLIAIAAPAAAALGLGALAVATPSAGELLRQDPPTTQLLEQRRSEARAAGRPFHPRMQIVPLERLSPRLIEAVLLAEDASFWSHHGFDWREIRLAAEAALARRRLGRGASTVTQQLAKNLWLGTERSLWRKAREAVLAWKLERSLPKRRILALYLGVAEWGDGVFGAEEAARHWFDMPARDLDAARAALLASMLPAPRRADLAAAPRWLAGRARRLLDRMREVRRIGVQEHARASAELERLLAGGRRGGDHDLDRDLEPELDLDQDLDGAPHPRAPEANRPRPGRDREGSPPGDPDLDGAPHPEGQTSDEGDPSPAVDGQPPVTGQPDSRQAN